MATGRPPKSPELRRSRQRPPSSAATMPARGAAGFTEVVRPALPSSIFPGRKVHRQTALWWKAIWRSEMAGRWLDSDIPGLHRLALLVNAFYLDPQPRFSAEIRQAQGEYGLTPFGRKKLDWRIEGPIRTPFSGAEPEPEPDEGAGDEQPAPRPRRREGPDPRSVLRAV
jgi:hypothetical protein